MYTFCVIYIDLIFEWMSISSIKEERDKNSYSVYAVEIAIPWSAVAVPSYDVCLIHSPARHLTLTANVLLSFRPASSALLRNNAIVQIAFLFCEWNKEIKKVSQASTLDPCGISTVQGANMAGSKHFEAERWREVCSKGAPRSARAGKWDSTCIWTDTLGTFRNIVSGIWDQLI
jgi:hypothetical protein